MAPANTSPGNVRPGTVTTFEFTPDDTGSYVIHHNVHGFNDTLIIESQGTTNVEDQAKLPVVYALQQNFPNPFNPVTALKYALPLSADVLLVIYDVSGREVTRLVDGIQPPGDHQVQWAGKDQSGLNVSSGTYIARLLVPPKAGVTPEYSKSIKMVLLK